MLQGLGRADALVGCGDFYENPTARDAELLEERNEGFALVLIGSGHRGNSNSTLRVIARVSYAIRGSTDTDTRPGTIREISTPT